MMVPRKTWSAGTFKFSFLTIITLYVVEENANMVTASYLLLEATNIKRKNCKQECKPAQKWKLREAASLQLSDA